MARELKSSPNITEFLQEGGDSLYQDYAALTDGAGLLTFGTDGIFRIGGRDRVDWLHKLTTVNIKALPEGRGAYGLVLNGTAHVIADFVVLALPESLVLHTSQAAADKLHAHLRRAILRDKISIERDDDRVVLTLQGPHSRPVLDETFGALPPLDRYQPVAKDSLIVIRNPRANLDGYDLLVPRGQLEETEVALSQHGAQRIAAPALNVARIEAGIPWFGEDFDETMLAPETRLDAFIAENKGCYPGQEVIARIRNRGHVNRLLVQFLFDGNSMPQRGDLAFSGDREVGWITSPTWSYVHRRPLALGYIRRELAEKGTRVQVQSGIGRVEAQVSGP